MAPLILFDVAWIARTLGSVVIASGVAVGFEGCPGDYWQLDPPNRVAYEGPHVEEVVACAEQVWRHAAALGGVYDDGLPVRVLAKDIDVLRRDSAMLDISGRSVYEFASSPDVVREWECVAETWDTDKIKVTVLREEAAFAD